MYDLVAMGELLFDFSYFGSSPRGNGLYEANPGGAPANVLVGAQRLGASTSFIGKIGNDALSLGLRNVLNANGVDTSGLILQNEFNTAMTFVQLDRKGDRSFSFYRAASADMNIRQTELNQALLRQGKIFHFGSLTLTDEPSRSATMFAARTVRENGGKVSFDPNYRSVLWRDRRQAREVIGSVLPLCDILKVSQEELELLTEEAQPRKALESLQREYGIPLLLATFGPEGSAWLFDGRYGEQNAFDVPTVDTTGAGDSFVAAVLYQVACVYGGMEKMQVADLSATIRFASAASSLATTVPGAIPALPALQDVEKLLSLKEN